MEEHTEEMRQELDNELATFVDQLLNQASNNKTNIELAGDPELRRLQETVLIVQKSLKDIQPDPGLSKRIEKNLVQNWTGASSQSRPSLWTRLRRRPPPEPSNWRSTSNARRTQAFRLAFATVVLLALGAIFVPKISTALTGAVIAPGSLVPFFLVAGVILVAVIFWFMNRGK
jgi:hypothetical protein